MEKRQVLGVGISICDVDSLAQHLIARAIRRDPCSVEAAAVYNLIIAKKEPAFRSLLNSFDVVTPDGQIVFWALRLLWRSKLVGRVTARELAFEVLAKSKADELRLYLYGDEPHTVTAVLHEVEARFGHVSLAGCEPSPFRALSQDDIGSLAMRIRNSNANLVFVAIGCPRQEWLVGELIKHVEAVVMCVGSAFKYWAGERKMPSRFIQSAGLEWSLRLIREPRRLWRRYLIECTQFIPLVAIQWFRQRTSGRNGDNGRNLLDP